MDQLATALRQVARMLWGIHVTLQMGFEQEASPTSHAHSCTLVLQPICMLKHAAVPGLVIAVAFHAVLTRPLAWLT